MNYAHNPNHYAPTPEMTVEQVRLRDLMRAVENANYCATNEVDKPAAITVTEVSAVPYVPSNSGIEIESRRLVEAAFAPQTVEQPLTPPVFVPEAQILQHQPRPTEPNTLPIDELRRAA